MTRMNTSGLLLPAAAGLAVLLCAHRPAQAQLDYDPDRRSISVGAGSLAYIAQESPATAFSLNGRFNYRLLSRLDFESSLLAAFSQSVDDVSATLPVLTEAGFKLSSSQYGPISLFGAAGVGWGAYFGSETLQDGLTMTVPLGVGMDWSMRRSAISPRFTYRPVFGDELGEEEADADSWAAALEFQLPYL